MRVKVNDAQIAPVAVRGKGKTLALKQQTHEMNRMENQTVEWKPSWRDEYLKCQRGYHAYRDNSQKWLQTLESGKPPPPTPAK